MKVKYLRKVILIISSLIESIIIMTSQGIEQQPQQQQQSSSLNIRTDDDDKSKDLKARMRRLTFGASKELRYSDPDTAKLLDQLHKDLQEQQQYIQAADEAERQLSLNNIQQAAALVHADQAEANEESVRSNIKIIRDEEKRRQMTSEKLIQNQELIEQNKQLEHALKFQSKQIEELTASKSKPVKNKRQSIGGKFSTSNTGAGLLKPNTFLQQQNIPQSAIKFSDQIKAATDVTSSSVQINDPSKQSGQSSDIQKDLSSLLQRNNQEEEEEDDDNKHDNQGYDPPDDDDDDDDGGDGGGPNPNNNAGFNTQGGNRRPIISSKSLVAKPLYFTGDEDTTKPGVLTIDVWIGSVIDYLTVNNVPKRLQVITAASYLSGSARQWWNSYQLDFYNAGKGFNEFKDSLFDQFQPYDTVNNSIQMIRRLFMGTKYQTVQSYIFEFDKLAIRIPRDTMNEQARIVMFTEGLTIEIKTALIHGNYTSLRSIQAAATRIESQLKSITGNRNSFNNYSNYNQSTRGQSQGSFRGRGRGRGGRGRGGSRSQSNNNDSQSSNHGSNETSKSTNPSSYNVETSDDYKEIENQQYNTKRTAIEDSIKRIGKARTEQRKQNGQCFTCGGSDHLAYQCNQTQANSISLKD